MLGAIRADKIATSVYLTSGDIPNMFATGGGTSGGETVGMLRTGSPDLTHLALLALLGAFLTGVALELALRKV